MFTCQVRDFLGFDDGMLNREPFCNSLLSIPKLCYKICMIVLRIGRFVGPIVIVHVWKEKRWKIAHMYMDVMCTKPSKRSD